MSNYIFIKDPNTIHCPALWLRALMKRPWTMIRMLASWSPVWSTWGPTTANLIYQNITSTRPWAPLLCISGFGEPTCFSKFVFFGGGLVCSLLDMEPFVEFHCATPSKAWPTEPLRRWNHQLWISLCFFGRLWGWSGFLLQVYLFGTFWTLSCLNTTEALPPR
jgi:hypothetical protein